MPLAAASIGPLHYRDVGAPQGPAIVFCNSLGTDLSIWDGLVPELATDYRLVSHDQRGHGASAAPDGPYSIAGLAGDLLELVDGLGVARFVLVGVSVGGLVAQRFALDHPERVLALVLCDTAAKIGDAAGWNARIDAVRAGGMAAIADAVLSRWFPPAIRAGRETEIAHWRDLLLGVPTEGYVGTCAALRDADLTPEIAGLTVPALVVVGAEDAATPVELVRATAALIPGARFEIIQGAGHIPSIDQPVRLAALIRAHIKEHVDGRPFR